MKEMIRALSGALVLATSAVAGAQTPVPMTVGANAPMLTKGTPIVMRTVTPLTTEGKQLKVGQRFDLAVAEAVSVNGQVVIPAGSTGIGEVVSVRNKGMWGKSGNIEARVLSITANGREMRVTGRVVDKGTTGTAGVVGAAVLVPVAGFFITGTSAVIASGTTVMATLDEDVPLAFGGAAAPTPMAVPPSPIVAASVTK